MDALRNHHVAVFPQGLKVVAFVDRGEGAKCFERGAGQDHLVLLELHGHRGAVRAGLRHWQRNQLRRHFQMPHADAGIAPPHIHHRSAAAVVGRIHAQEVFLLETRFQRQYPVRPLLVGAALI